MKIVVVTESWPHATGVEMSARETADEVVTSWGSITPDTSVEAFAIGDGGARSADAVAGPRLSVGGAQAVRTEAGLILEPADGASRWEPHALATALLGLAAEHSSASPALTVVVPVGDTAPAGDATDVWLGGLAPMRAGVAALNLQVGVSSQRPLLGFNGMSAALRDGRENDAVIGQAAQAQEERWAGIAADADEIASVKSLLGSTRLSDMPGTGAAGGLAYALAALGGRLVPSAHTLATLAGAESASASADLVVAVVPALVPRTLDDGVVPAASALAASYGIPAVVIAPGSRIGRRDLMNAGLVSAHEGEPGPAGLRAVIRRVAQTWTPRR